MNRDIRRLSISIVTICLTMLAAAATARAAAGNTHVILSNSTIWRSLLVARTPIVRIGNELKKVELYAYGGVWVLPKAGSDVQPVSETPAPPANWMAADFDDANWARSAGPFFPSGGWAYTKEVDDAGFCEYENTDPTLATICLRGKFIVDDPGAAGDLKLSLAYRGGVVVYLNGTEIARASIAESQKSLGLEALADDYPKEEFVTPAGKVIRSTYGDPQKYFNQLQSRIRHLDDVIVPSRLLRKGVNVLAIEAHRAPQSDATFGTSNGRGKGYVLTWCTVGVPRIELTGSAGITPNDSRPAGEQVWNQDSSVRVKASDYGDPCEPLRPIELIAAQNGSFSGEVVIGSTKPIQAIKVAAGDLVIAGNAPAKIPAANVQIRFALDDPDDHLPFDILSSDLPSAIGIDKSAGAAVVPVWVTVHVPPDAQPGNYTGTVSLNVNGDAPRALPIMLHIVDWRLPDSTHFISHVGLIESPESVAMKYHVPLWSEAHWKLIEKSFDVMAEAGADDVFITAIRRTHFGNEEGMIRWIKQPDGSIKPDLSIAERYLDLAIKHLGKVPVVCLYCWEPFTGSNYGGKESDKAQGMPYTLIDPATGKTQDAVGPKWGTPEVRAFWKPVFDGLREILKKRGMEDSLMVGVAGDSRPNKDAVDDLKAMDPNAKWVLQSHMLASELSGQPVGYLADVWNSPSPPDPSVKRLHGWKNPFLRVSFPREGSGTLVRTNSPLAQYRVALEETSAAGIRGIGRMGADFWEVLPPNAPFRNGYSRSLNILGRFIESNWAQLYVGNSTPYVLAPGPEGALATARFEMLREGAQDLEARIFLEKILLDPPRRAKIGDDLAARCQELLDDRVRAIRIGRASWRFFTGEHERLEKLYDLAGEASAKLANGR